MNSTENLHSSRFEILLVVVVILAITAAVIFSQIGQKSRWQRQSQTDYSVNILGASYETLNRNPVCRKNQCGFCRLCGSGSLGMSCGYLSRCVEVSQSLECRFDMSCL
ncbi:MAG: hypothetical protein UV73_C0005G0096 [Candidatus Gottesmanbacteria bacterium GW2011_GWA2_43_14]|uniref:Uncharacterized protein n=1 Tax=Candidatus Gottesmanbacteria bacterium GW2011_GWA2_43_14 TaxID=1618443 RepID=A0A0G1DJH0_9BACT|nr:MAG: hypothetical protein UV73_C0005G0096 [Candidatus Gottesmanbacteria bacterium GW2011_GWA2_43_14]